MVKYSVEIVSLHGEKKKNFSLPYSTHRNVYVRVVNIKTILVKDKDVSLIKLFSMFPLSQSMYDANGITWLGEHVRHKSIVTIKD